MNIYEQALQVIDKQGWRKGTSPGACLVTSIMDARMSYRGSIWEEDEAIEHLASLIYGEGLNPPADVLSLIRFNDDPSTTEEDVRLLLKRAAAGD